MFLFDFNWEIQHFLNQFWLLINFCLLILAVTLAYLSYKNPIRAIGLTIILLPSYLLRSKIGFLPITFLEVCIGITFFGWLAKRLKTKQQKNKIKYLGPIFLILTAASLSLLISPNPTAAAGLWKAYFVEPILFFMVTVNTIKSKKDREIILWSLGISTLIISILAIYQKFSGFGIAEASWMDPEKRRVTSIFTSPNAVGLYLGPIIAIYLGWVWTEIKNWKKTSLKLTIIIPALTAMLFTVSQGTWLGITAATVFLGFFGWNKKITSAIVLLATILILMFPTSRNLVWPIITFQDAAGQNRLTLWHFGTNYLTDSPKNFFLGAGLFGFSKIQNQFREPLTMEPLLYPHNIILNFWLEIGLLGLIAFGWLIIKFFKNGINRLKSDDRLITFGLMAAMITIIVHGLIDVPYFKNDLSVLFWLIISLI